MPRARRDKKPPEGFVQIEPTLNKLLARLKDAQTSSIKTENKKQALWPVIRLNHQISRYIYTMYYQRKAISSDLYQWLLKQKYCNADLIAKWKKQGYEHLCCIACITTNETNHGNTCICRVPKTALEDEEGRLVECITCGCRGCASSD